MTRVSFADRIYRRAALIAGVLLLTAFAGGAAYADGLSNTKPGDVGSGETTTAPQVSTAAEAEALGGLLPDIQEEIPQHLAIQNKQQQESLRFSTTHWNFGDGNLQIHGGGQVAPCVIDGVHYDQCTYATQEILNSSGNIVATHPAGVAFFHPEHNHWHQSAVATFALRTTPTGSPIGQTRIKTTFCLVDVDASTAVAQKSTRDYFECNGELQGLTVGWGDEYHQSTEGQELDVTGLPAGVYYLTQDADPDQHWLETDDTNNTAWVKLQLSRKGANPEVTILDSFGYEGNSSNA